MSVLADCIQVSHVCDCSICDGVWSDVETDMAMNNGMITIGPVWPMCPTVARRLAAALVEMVDRAIAAQAIDAANATGMEEWEHDE